MKKWTICLLASLVVLGFLKRVCANDENRPNVIMVMCDDLGWADLRFNNPDSRILTPHLDRMAAQSLVFRRFYSAAPVCSPTRGSSLTGRHPYRYGIYTANRGHMKKQEITLAEILKQQGYATGHFGKWHLGTLTKTVKDSNRGGPDHIAHYSPPWENGFDRCFSTEAKVPTFDPMLRPKDGGRVGWDFIRDRENATAYGTRYWNEDGKVVTDGLEGDDSKIIMDRATQFIEKQAKAKKPFFAVVWFHTPHLPVVAGADSLRPYKSLDMHHRNYFGCITAMDQQIGRLRQQLKDLKVSKNTIIFFCSDNGPEGNMKSPGSAKPFRGRKRSLYEGGVRVPALIEWPAKISSHRQVDFPAVTSDYLPTILAALDLKMPDNRPLDGVNLLPVIEGNAKVRKKAIGFQSGNQKTWVGQRYKIYQGKKKSWELYDLINDPSESNDLASSKPELVKSLAKEFQAWKQSCQKSDQGGDYRDTNQK